LFFCAAAKIRGGRPNSLAEVKLAVFELKWTLGESSTLPIHVHRIKKM
jgi:hypothetical protein